MLNTHKNWRNAIEKVKNARGIYKGSRVAFSMGWTVIKRDAAVRSVRKVT